ncbi:hypothetical protein GYH30_052158 [Glycine max]|nr:hypothetical protein GYH30_052158 [Glycine max]
MRGSGVTEQDGVAAISRQWPWWVVRSDRVNERPGWKWRLIGRKRRSVSGMGSMVSIINEIVFRLGMVGRSYGKRSWHGCVSVGGDFAEEEDGGDLGEDGVGVRMNSRQRMTLSLVVIFRVWVVMVDRFWGEVVHDLFRRSIVWLLWMGMVEGKGNGRGYGRGKGR